MTTHAPPAPRGARFSPDRPFVGVGVVVIVLIVMLAAMAFSFIALYEAAEWTHNPQEFWWLAPVIIDGPILVYTASYAVWRWRGIDKFAHHAMRVLIFFTSLSVTVNTLHVGSGWEWQWTSPEVYGGIAMAAVAPIGALLAAHELTRLVFMNHDEGDEFEQTEVEAKVAELVEEKESLAQQLAAFQERDESDIAADVIALIQPQLDELLARPVPTPPDEDSESEPEPAPRPTASLLVAQEVSA